MLLKEQLLTSGQYNVEKTSNKLFVWGLGTSGQVTTVTYLFSLAQLSAGQSHTVALTSDSRMLLWGLNSSGQLGTNDALNRSFPTQVGGKGWKKVTAGSSFTVAVRSDGALFTWGNNSSGQLGNATTINRSSPTQIGQGVSWLNVSAGQDYALATTNSLDYYAWGLNSSGQLGNNTTVNRSAPTQVTHNLTDISLNLLPLTLGLTASLNLLQVPFTNVPNNLTTNGTSVALNLDKTTGSGVADQITTPSTSVFAIGAYTDYTIEAWIYVTSFTAGSTPFIYSLGTGGAAIWQIMGVNSTGVIFWGHQAGIWVGATSVQSAPGIITVNTWYHVALIKQGTLFTITVNGTAVAGTNFTVSNGQGGTLFIGTYYNNQNNDGSFLRGYISNFRMVAGTAVYSTPAFSVPTSALTTTSQGVSSVNVNLLTLQSSTIVDNSTNAYTLTTFGSPAVNTTIIPFGSTSSYQFNGTNTWVTGPSAIIPAGTGDFTMECWFYQPSAAGTMCILDLSGNGTGPAFATTTGPTFLVGLTSGVNLFSGITISLATWYHAALTRQSGVGRIYLNGQLRGVNAAFTNTITSGTVFIGRDSRGNNQFWNGYISNIRVTNNTVVYTAGSFSSPTSPLTAVTNTVLLQSYSVMPSFVQLSASSGGSSYGIDANNSLYSWGNNAAGQLGISTTVNRPDPIRIGTSSWSSISAGSSHVAAISADNTLFTWGLNNAGQLGLNNIINRSSPVQVTTVASWRQVTAGTSFTLGIASTQLLYGWGLNNNYQTGIVASTINRSTPQQITTGSWALIAAGGLFSNATNDNKLLYSWGNGSGGVLGDGVTAIRSSPTLVSFNQTISQSSPIQVGTDSWSMISSGNNFFAAIRSDGLLYGWGSNTDGVLGDNSIVSKSSPVQIGTSSWTAVATASNATLALRSDNTLWGWGGFSSSLLPNIENNRFISLANGPNFQVGIRPNGTLWAWGLNSSGQLGLGNTLNRSSPTQITSVSGSFVSVMSGESYAAALRSDNTLWVWGGNSNGQLGLSNTINRSAPVQITGSWNFIAVGARAMFAASSGVAYGWGLNDNGQLGDNSTISKSSPTLLASPFNTTSWSSISTGTWITAAIRDDGTLFTWGRNQSGQLGNNSTINRSNPVTVTGGFSWTFVTASINNVWGIITNGNMYGWGANSTIGTLGDNTVIPKSNPVQIGIGNQWSFIGKDSSYGTSDTGIAITTTGAVWFWGVSNSIQYNGTTLNRSSPTLLTAASTLFRYTYANPTGPISLLRDDGTLFSWGINTNGGIGDNTTVNKNTAVQIGTILSALSSPVQIGLGAYTRISANTFNAAAIDSAGGLFTWGVNASGQLGDNTGTITRLFPNRIDANSWQTASVGVNHMLALRNFGMLFAWGNNSNTQLGNDTTTNTSSPIQITATATGTVTSWIAVSAGNNHSMAIDSANTLYAWGLNNAGQLGIVTDLYSWNQVALGYSHEIAIRSDNTLWGWGTGTTGQLGLNDILNRSSPTQIGTSSWTVVSANNLNSAAIRSDGILFTWGSGTNLQIGDGFAITRSSPVQIGSSSWIQVSVGNAHNLAIDAQGRLFGWGIATALNASTAPFSWTLVSENTSHTAAIRSDGLLFVWGLNTAGQIGNNNTISQSSPVQIGTSSWISVSAGVNHTLGVTTDYRLFAWGGNQNFNLGDNSTVNKSSPIQIGTGLSWTQVDAASSYSLAITSTNSLYAWGVGTAGQLGTLTEIKSWSTVSAGNSTSMGITADGRMFVWGLNTGFQIGDGSSITKSSPVQVGLPLSWSIVSSGVNHSLAITNTGQLYGWGTATTGATGNYGEIYSWSMVAGSGDNWYGIRSDGSLWATGSNTRGALGLNDNVARSSPTQVGSSSYIFVNAGGSTNFGTAMAITTDNRLFGWGYNELGQLGLNDVINRSSPTQIDAGNLYSYAAPFNHTLLIRTNGTMWATGFNSSEGRLGLNDLISRSNPTQIGTSTWTVAFATDSHSLAIRSDNTLWTWGRGTENQLGNGTSINRSSPVQVTSPGTSPWIGIAGGFAYSVGITGLGLGTPYSVYVWGGNNNGATGLNTTVGNNATPVVMKAGSAGNSFIQVTANPSAGASTPNTFILSSNGQMWSMGHFSLIGNNVTNVSRSSPVLVFGSTSWSQLPKMVGDVTMGVLATNSTLWTWGNINNYTTYGPGILQSSPVQVGGNVRWANYERPLYTVNSEPGQGSWTSVSAGNSFSLGIKNNLAYGWGQNSLGQTGTNKSTNPTLSPTQIGSGSWSVVSSSETGNFAGGITSDNKLFMWGTGAAQLAIYTTGSDFSWSQVSTSEFHSMGIKSDGSLYTWGYNLYGQLGDLTTIDKSSPIQIGSDSWLMVSAGLLYSAAIRTDGTLWMWGRGLNGATGLLTVANRSSPQQVSGGGSWAMVNAQGFYDTAAIKSDGTLWAWGQATAFLNNLTFAANPRSSPMQIGTLLWKKVVLGGQVGAAIRSDDTLWTFGDNIVGALGAGVAASGVVYSSPIQVGAASWRNITVNGSQSAGGTSMVGIQLDGTLWSWGEGSQGQLGDNRAGNPTYRISRPQQIGSKTWRDVAAGGSVAIAVDDNGEAYVWGLGSGGRLPFNDVVNRSSPTLLSGTYTSLVNHGMGVGIGVVDSSNNLFLWGTNNFGLLGDNSTTNKSSPVQLAGTWGTTIKAYQDYNFLNPALSTIISSPVQIGNSSWTQLSVGGSHSLAIRADNTLWTWGLNSTYQLGITDTITRSSPVQIGTDTNWLSVSAGLDHSMAIKTNNTLWGWGFNLFGQVGLATTVYSWTQVANTGLTTHAIRSDGLLFGWGLNTSGEIGDNSIINKSSPVQVGIKTWKKVYNFTAAVGNLASVLAIDNNDNLFAWGNNTSGNLGDNTVISRSSPVAVVIKGTGSYTQVFVGPATVAIQNDGTLWSWGAGSFVGDNTIISRSSPVQIGSSTWSAVGGALSTIAAIDATGRLFTWGNQSASGSGSLGTNDLINRSSPTLVAGAPGAFSWTSVSSGGANHILAIRDDGAAYGTGLNTQGQLGDNTAVNRSVFSLVSGTTRFTQVRCGFSFTIASASDGTLWGWGNNDWGQLTTTLPIAANRSNPVQIVAPGPTVYSTGQYNLATIYSNGLLYNQGYNLNGMLGDGTTTSRSLPVQIGNNPIINISVPVQIGTGSWNQVNAGTQYTLARDTNNVLYAWGQDTSGQLGL